ncbi:MAG TPA: hypothetical protein VHG09_01015 [Longimicrobiales bacterium]|nr:hypothetical protein [Longimicrobiales bacterium]
MITRSTAAVLIIALSACSGGDPADVPSVATTDVDGVIHVRVESLAPADVRQWNVHEVFTTSAPETRVELYQVSAARFLPDDALAVANSGTGEIITLDSLGREITRRGGKGEGPGEFTWISHLDVDSAGTLTAYDPRQGRLTRVPADSGAATTRPFAPPDFIVDLQPLAVLDDNRVAAVYGEMRVFARSGERRDTTPLMMFDADGARADTIAMWPATEWAFMSSGDGAMRSPVGFGRSASYAGRNGRFAVGANDSIDVVVYDASTEPAMRISGPPGTAVDPAAVELWRSEVESRWSDMPEEMRRGLADLPHRPTYPGFETLVVDDDGSIWIGSYARPGQVARDWLVIGRDGHAQARVTLPSDAKVLDIAGGRIALVMRDDLGEEHISVFRIVR